MDPVTTSALAASAFAILKPYLPVIANKAAEAIGSQLPTAAGKLWNALKPRLDQKEAAKGALSDLLKGPEDADLQAAFRVQIRKILEEDPGFASEIKGLVEEASQQIEVKVRDGAAAVGDHAKAVGKGGTLIEGDVKGDFIGPGAKVTRE